MEITGDMSTDAKLFNTLRKTNPTLEKLRSIGKRATLTSLASLYGNIHRKSHKCWKPLRGYLYQFIWDEQAIALGNQQAI